jgi:hypothetical protein
MALIRWVAGIVELLDQQYMLGERIRDIADGGESRRRGSGCRGVGA